MKLLDRIKSTPRQTPGSQNDTQVDSGRGGLPLRDSVIDSVFESTGGREQHAGQGAYDRAPAFGMPDAQAMDADSSIISEVTPSQLPDDDASRADAQQAPGSRAPALPLIGALSIAVQQRVLMAMMLLGALLVAAGVVFALDSSTRNAVQADAAAQAAMHAQRLARSATQAVAGQAAAFAVVRDSATVLGRSVRGLVSGEDGLPVASQAVLQAVEDVLPVVDRTEKHAAALLAQEPALTRMAASVRALNRRGAAFLEAAEAVSALKLQQGAAAAELAAASQLVMLTQRIGKSANEFLSIDGVGPEAVSLLGKDLDSFGAISRGLADGSVELRLPGTRDPQLRARLDALQETFAAVRADVAGLLDNPSGVAAAREAHNGLLGDSEALRSGLESVQQRLGAGSGFNGARVFGVAGGALLLLFGGWGFVRLSLRNQAVRAQMSEMQRHEAERQEHEAKRVNDANQAAILRLMNELQTVAEGDLTQQATVTEDITGAIADSVNYTVEELRTLVSQVIGTVSRVTETTEQVDATSTELLAASTEQLREIRATGESVLQMAGRINDVSAQAQQTAEVARRSLQAAESGRAAVQNTIGGMNAIRDQIQETSKRIKRLGESSQEIGEITELISDITEQTNVLALNAAIQAASAGEAGRGFSVVAEEVQRLAERSADATRQIAALVKTIQTDTQDAVAAMERSTQGVVEGARLSDAAGAALGDIDRVTHQLSELIGRISHQALQEAQSANVVAANIQHIFAVTEQTGDGTRSTAQMVRELSKTADELKQSVARFKID